MRLFLFILGGLGLLVAGYVSYSKLRPRQVTSVFVKRGRVIEAVYASGTVEAQSRVVVKARIPGSIMELPVHEGSPVEARQLLLRIAAPTLDLDVAKSQAELRAASQRFVQKPHISSLRHQLRVLQVEQKQAQLDVIRLKGLYTQHATTQQELERAEAKLEILQAQIASNLANQHDLAIGTRAELEKQKANVSLLQARSEDSKLYSPMKGVILHLNVARGESVTQNQELMRIGDIDHLVIEALVGEEDIGHVQAGMMAVVRFYAFGTRTFRAHVLKIAPDANRDLKSFQVDLALNEPTFGLLSGMTCQIDIFTRQSENALLIPADAVLEDSVWVVQNHVLHHRKVTLGIRNLDTVEVLSGLSEGERITFVNNDSRFVEGERVQEIELAHLSKGDLQ